MMGEGMARLTADQRANASACGHIVDQIFVEACMLGRTRRKCLRFLADSIAFAAGHWPDRWSVTLHPTYIRFNVGWVEAIVLDRVNLAVLVMDSRMPREVDLGRAYPRARGARLAVIPLRNVGSVLPHIVEAHRQAMQAAATWRTGSRTRKAHSPGVVEYLWRTLGLETRPPTIEDNVAEAPTLHIVQGGVKNGDKRWLERAAKRDLVATDWVVPKSVRVGDDVVVYVRGHGLFATARISSPPKPNADWPNRYGADINAVRLIEPPISLELLRVRITEFPWARYPRSITTPGGRIAEKLRTIIEVRCKRKGADLEEGELRTSSLEELRAAALAKAAPNSSVQQKSVNARKRELAVKAYVLRRADGCCEYCQEDAPFRTDKGQPYLETHHILRLVDSGPDHPANVIGVCPNCHRRAHFADDRRKIKDRMRRRVRVIEARHANEVR